MKKYLLLLLLVAMPVQAIDFMQVNDSVITWGFDNIARAREWVSPDGRMNNQTLYSNSSTALDLWPTNGTEPDLDSLAEITIHRHTYAHACISGGQANCDERISFSAMPNRYFGGAFRIGVEAIGDGAIHRPIIFCFENVPMGASTCKLLIGISGVYVNDATDGGDAWRKL